MNLAGFSLRPGFGLAVDDWRVAQTWRLFPTRTLFPKNEVCQAEWWILWRRLAGGLTQGQQHTLAEPHLSVLRTYLRKAGTAKGSPLPYGVQEGAEVFRVLGSLELLKTATKTELGELLRQFISRDRPIPLRDAAIWAIGRIGARVPVYGPLNALLPVETVEIWATAWVAAPVKTSVNAPVTAAAKIDEKIAFALAQLTRRTGDRYRDVSDDLRRAVLDRLATSGASAHLVALVREGGQLQAEEQKLVFGESLPRGLRIE